MSPPSDRTLSLRAACRWLSDLGLSRGDVVEALAARSFQPDRGARSAFNWLIDLQATPEEIADAFTYLARSPS